MLRADLHHHIDTDPVDGRFVRHSIGELIDRAAALGTNLLAVTCHKAVPYDGDATRYAAERGVMLLRGMEASVDGTHVLLLNFRDFPPGECTIAEIAARKTPESLVIAPHPFYPSSVAAAKVLREHREVFDAVEHSGLYTALTGHFNRRAIKHGRKVGLPVVGNTDTHFLWQLGYTYSLIDAPPEVPAVVEAIRRGRVRVVTRPLPWTGLIRFAIESGSAMSMLADSLGFMTRVVRRTRTRAGAPPEGAPPEGEPSEGAPPEGEPAAG